MEGTQLDSTLDAPACGACLPRIRRFDTQTCRPSSMVVAGDPRTDMGHFGPGGPMACGMGIVLGRLHRHAVFHRQVAS